MRQLKEIKQISEGLSTWIDLDYYYPNKIEFNKHWGFNRNDIEVIGAFMFELIFKGVQFHIKHTQLNTFEVWLNYIPEENKASLNAGIIRILKEIDKCKALIY